MIILKNSKNQELFRGEDTAKASIAIREELDIQARGLAAELGLSKWSTIEDLCMTSHDFAQFYDIGLDVVNDPIDIDPQNILGVTVTTR